MESFWQKKRDEAINFMWFLCTMDEKASSYMASDKNGGASSPSWLTVPFTQNFAINDLYLLSRSKQGSLNKLRLRIIDHYAHRFVHPRLSWVGRLGQVSFPSPDTIVCLSLSSFGVICISIHVFMWLLVSKTKSLLPARKLSSHLICHVWWV